MIHPPASVRVYLATTPCDMRRSFDGLHALVNAVMQLDALAGHLFVFANRRRDRVKILYWDRDGFAVWAKRLEEGTYAMPFSEGERLYGLITSPKRMVRFRDGHHEDLSNYGAVAAAKAFIAERFE